MIIELQVFSMLFEFKNFVPNSLDYILSQASAHDYSACVLYDHTHDKVDMKVLDTF